jgi:hypothetical protein
MKTGAIDLTIPLTPSQVKPIKRWITTFMEKEKNWAEYPFLKGKTLHVSAMCFPFLLAYADATDSNEFDLARLKILGKREMEKRINHQGSPTLKTYFQKALDNLDFMKVGEFLENPPKKPTSEVDYLL